MSPSRGEIWFVKRDLYLADYLPAFRALGFSTRMVERAEAEKAGLDGHERPLFLVDTNIGAPTFRLVNGRGIPFVGLVFDYWYFSPRLRYSLDQSDICQKLNIDPCMSAVDWNFSPGSPVFLKDLPPVRPSGLFLFPCDPEQVVTMKGVGLMHVEQMHMGVDPDRFRPLELAPEERQRFQAPVSFVGTPLTDPEADSYLKLSRGIALTRRQVPPDQTALCDSLQGLLDDLVAAQAGDLFRYRLPELIAPLEKKHGVRFFFPPEMKAEKETLAIRLGVHLSMRQRVAAVQRLAPFGIAVYGPKEWRDVEAPGMDYRGEANWATDLPKAINASSINVNVSKLMFGTSVAPRIFETLACGRFLLSNRNAGIAGLFEDGKDLVFYESLDDLEDKVRYYLDRPEERRAIGEHGRRTVLARHTLLHRARRIVSVLEEAGVLPPGP